MNMNASLPQNAMLTFSSNRYRTAFQSVVCSFRTLFSSSAFHLSLAVSQSPPLTSLLTGGGCAGLVDSITRVEFQREVDNRRASSLRGTYQASSEAHRGRLSPEVRRSEVA
ncbi:hypothetical protein KC347_g26 [Hortaea werneckii]|nr:hypothetical protein KC347_g26 [Hortaea werneckii]